MCGVQSNTEQRAKDLMLILGLNEAMHQLAMASNVRFCGHVFRMEDSHVLRG